ncbi:hypothetical protein GHT06_004117 [Daphnia sinensis]|uniref:Aminotransferase class V domain-containing protein n=1 Tax=Daphnia sinensis TaxID=1820382 RepID=A0AAD5KEQ5_9CRUS|nr:hypothetical protein GHT06_004117 [Daphnia sinensis]
MLCEAKGAILKIIPINESGEIIFEELEKLLSTKTKMVSIVHASNALGTINPVRKIIEAAHQVGAKVLLDGAQSTSHLEINVQDLDCDFLAFSAHKLYGPTGLGVLYGKREILEDMPPFLGGKSAIKEHEDQLLHYAVELLSPIKGFTPVGTASEKVSVLSFNLLGMHPFDVGMMLDSNGIAVRTGHHCTQPLMKRLGLEGTVRASFAVYNTKKEVEKLAESVAKIAHIKNK